MKKTILCALLAAVLALMPFAGMAADQPVVMLAGISMYPGDVLHCTNTMVGFPLENPTGYAEVSADGKTLTLHNFDNNGFCGENVDTHDESALILYGPVTLNLQGQNKLSNSYSVGEGISAHGDLTIKGTGSLEIDADWGIYNWESGNLAITSGDLTIKGRDVNIRSYNTTITGGKVDLTSERNSGIASYYDVTISGGEVNIDAKEGIFCNEDIIISGGEVNIEAKEGIYCFEDIIISGGEVNFKGMECAVYAEGEMQLTGGKITVTSLNKAIKANKIICTLPIPEGVEIRSVDDHEMMDYTDFLDTINTERWDPQWRTFQLIGQTDAPSVPTTGDNANIALWTALAVMSVATMQIIRRRRTV